jgi:hypothetical protein
MWGHHDIFSTKWFDYDVPFGRGINVYLLYCCNGKSQYKIAKSGWLLLVGNWWVQKLHPPPWWSYHLMNPSGPCLTLYQPPIRLFIHTVHACQKKFPKLVTLESKLFMWGVFLSSMTAFFLGRIYLLHLATKKFKSSVMLANDFCEKKGSDVTRVRGIFFLFWNCHIYLCNRFQQTAKI